jgi:glycosyltransferase involved in cell wall biosynthesis
MKVSIITPVYNDTRVARCLEVVRRQDFDGAVERIVVDGGSDDETVGVLRKYDDAIDVLISEPDDGIYDAMNKGLGVATGDIAAILNADDCWRDRHVLSDVAKRFEDPSVDAVYADKALVMEDGRVARYWRAGEEARWKWYFGWMPPHPTFFVRRRLYEQYGNFDLDYPIAADYEFMLRTIFKNRINVEYIPRVLTRFQLGGNSNESIQDIVKANLEIRQIWKDHDLSFGQLVPFLKPGRKIFQYLRAIPYRRFEPGPYEQDSV